jgi:hypothetical protein
MSVGRKPLGQVLMPRTDSSISGSRARLIEPKFHSYFFPSGDRFPAVIQKKPDNAQPAAVVAIAAERAPETHKGKPGRAALLAACRRKIESDASALESPDIVEGFKAAKSLAAMLDFKLFRTAALEKILQALCTGNNMGANAAVFSMRFALSGSEEKSMLVIGIAREYMPKDSAPAKSPDMRAIASGLAAILETGAPDAKMRAAELLAIISDNSNAVSIAVEALGNSLYEDNLWTRNRAAYALNESRKRGVRISLNAVRCLAHKLGKLSGSELEYASEALEKCCMHRECLKAALPFLVRTMHGKNWEARKRAAGIVHAACDSGRKFKPGTRAPDVEPKISLLAGEIVKNPAAPTPGRFARLRETLVDIMWP